MCSCQGTFPFVSLHLAAPFRVRRSSFPFFPFGLPFFSDLEPLSLSVPLSRFFLRFWFNGLKWTRTTDLTLIRRAL